MGLINRKSLDCVYEKREHLAKLSTIRNEIRQLKIKYQYIPIYQCVYKYMWIHRSRSNETLSAKSKLSENEPKINIFGGGLIDVDCILDWFNKKDMNFYCLVSPSEIPAKQFNPITKQSTCCTCFTIRMLSRCQELFTFAFEADITSWMHSEYCSFLLL